MQLGGFARERLGWWTDVKPGEPEPVILADDWDRLATDEPPEGDKVAYGVKFSPDGMEVAVAVASMSGDHVHVELVHRESMSRGLSWLVAWIGERGGRASCAVIDGKSSAPTLIEQLGRQPYGYIVKAGAETVIAASGAFLDAVRSGTLSWYKGQDGLRERVTTSPKRRVGAQGGWAFGGADSAPVEAAALALWGVRTSKRDPRRKGMVG